MNRYEQYKADLEAERKAFWNAALGDAKPVPKEEFFRRIRQQAADNPPAAPPPPRNLAEEQEILRQLLHDMPWLRLRGFAEQCALPKDTFDSYLKAAPEAPKYRKLQDSDHADILWSILQTTLFNLRAALPPERLVEHRLPGPAQP